MRVILEKVNDSQNIVAPVICPFKERKNNLYVVHPSLCILCKKCDFYTEEESNSKSLLSEDDIRSYLLEVDSEASTLISSQISYLRRESRIPLVILISSVQLMKLLKHFTSENPHRYQFLLSHYINQTSSLCSISGCTVFFSSKLSQSLIQVVGEVRWR